ncbi:MAG: Dabb family protein [Planctomycetes bacterium]|nr:Dabb family protein [Planctomycetota bacterium]
MFFWLREGVDEAARAAFVEGLRGLGESSNVASCRVGVPAGSTREVVDGSWDYQLAIGFEGRAAHDRYQSGEDAVHAAFIARFRELWQRVVVYDSVPV